MLESRAASGFPFLISFSGIDGAGKTTQIENLSLHLRTQGLRVTRLSFWDDVAVWSNMRAGIGERVARIRPADEARENSFVAKNHKDLRKWYLTAVRSSLYILDVIRLRRLLKSSKIRNSDVVIFDRYVYDQIANVYSRRPVVQVYCRFLLKLTPSPNLALILDTSPDAAFARKPEYPLEFVQRNREDFLRLRELAPELVTIPGAGVDEVEKQIHVRLEQSRFGKVCVGETAEIDAKSTVDWPESCSKVQNEPTTTA